MITTDDELQIFVDDDTASENLEQFVESVRLHNQAAAGLAQAFDQGFAREAMSFGRTSIAQLEPVESSLRQLFSRTRDLLARVDELNSRLDAVSIRAQRLANRFSGSEEALPTQIELAISTLT